MRLKTEYFLKNYLLNFKAKKDRYSAYSLPETGKYYKLKMTVGNKSIIFNIVKTEKLDAPVNHVLTSMYKEQIHTLLCFYGTRETGDGDVLFMSGNDLKIAACNIDDKGNAEVNIGVNLIDEVFYHLSAIEEYNKEANGKDARPYYSGDAGKSTNEPLVDDFYNLFTDIINTCLEKLGVTEGMQRKLNGFNISLTHDVDAIRKNYFTSLRYLSFLAARFAKKLDFNAFGRIFRYLAHKSDFNQIINIMLLEKDFDYRSTFFFYSKAAKGGFSSRIIDKFIDPSYDMSSSAYSGIRNIFSEAEFEAGLHGSYAAARDYELLMEELKLLKGLSRTAITANRNHFLNFSSVHTPLLLEKAGIKCDTTFYYNNVCGFLRHKTCSPFYFYSHTENRIVDVIEIPTVIMDSTLFNYLNCTDETAYKKSIEILDKVKRRNGVVCINWHNETSTPEYGWYSTYKDVIKWIKDNSATAYTIGEVYNRLVTEGFDGATVNTG